MKSLGGPREHALTLIILYYAYFPLLHSLHFTTIATRYYTHFILLRLLHFTTHFTLCYPYYSLQHSTAKADPENMHVREELRKLKQQVCCKGSKV